jgi:AraC-like DNA-binding protein
VRNSPLCDYAEAGIWAAMGGGWECLYGCFCERGLSIEWHDFACAEPRDWSRSFHPDSIELCLNVSGHARVARGANSVLFGPMTVGIYTAAPGELAAWRLPGERHRFLTVEFSRAFLEHHLKGHELGLHASLRSALQKNSGGRSVSLLGPLTPTWRKRLDQMRHPPVEGAARGLWYLSQAIDLMAAHFFDSKPAVATEPVRRTQIARERVEKAIGILGEQLAEPPPLEELGRAVGCSPYYLSRTFSREMGMTISQYLRQMRMERAAEMLKSGRHNVTETALAVGYSSLSHFSHAFCETIGCCPGLYPLGLVGHRPVPESPGASRDTSARNRQKFAS